MSDPYAIEDADSTASGDNVARAPLKLLLRRWRARQVSQTEVHVLGMDGETEVWRQESPQMYRLEEVRRAV